MTLGLPDLLRLSKLNTQVAQVKRDADRARIEVVTGRIEDLTKASRGDVGGLHILRKAIDDSQGYQQTLTLSGTRAERTQRVLDTLNKDTSRLATDVFNYVGVGDDSGMKGAAADADGALRLVFANLNTDAGGRALFSGDRGDQSPLGDVDQLLSDVRTIVGGAADAAAAETALDQYFNDPAGGFATTIYQGGTGDAAPVELAPGVKINASLRADQQPFRDLIRGLAVVASYETTPVAGGAARDTLVRSAADRLLQTETKITDMRSELGVAENRIAQRIDELKTEEQTLTSLYNSRTTRDPYEAASELQLLQSQLEASYLITSKLSQLSLTQYLR
ncbi:MAG: hypothetical protein K2Q06_01865 [Parvularculaceae bacterium]|nr:hypothetical protein [Parvularculaceae bacterium]